MVNLLNLPEEIVQAVLERLDSHKTAISIAQTCRKLHRLAQSYIYTSLELDLGQAMKFFHSVSPQTKHIVLADPDEERIPTAPIAANIGFSTASGENKLNRVFKLSLKHRNSIAAGYFAPWIEQMNNLEELKIESWYWHWSDMPYHTGELVRRYDEDGLPTRKGESFKIDWPLEQWRLKEMFKWNSILTKNPASRILPSLRSCHVRYYELNGQTWFLDFEPIFFSTTIIELTLENCFFTDEEFENYLDENHGIRKDLRGVTPLERLSLVRCNIDPIPLSRMMIIPKSLKMLSLDQVVSAHHEMEPHHTIARTTKEFIDIFALQQQSLEELYITSTPNVAATNNPGRRDSSWPIDLRDFRSLRKLDLGDWMKYCIRSNRLDSMGPLLPASLGTIRIDSLEIQENLDKQATQADSLQDYLADFKAAAVYYKQSNCPELDTLVVPLLLYARDPYDFGPGPSRPDWAATENKYRPILRNSRNEDGFIVLELASAWSNAIHETVLDVLRHSVIEMANVGIDLHFLAATYPG